MRVVLANPGTVNHPTAGGHLSVRLQYLFALEDLGVDWYLLQLMRAGEDRTVDERLVARFFARLRQYGLHQRVAVIRFADWMQFDTAEVYGLSKSHTRQVIDDADVVWNLCNGLADPLLSQFRRKVFVDLDPGIIQATGREKRLRQLEKHDVLFTVGLNMHGRDCLAPTLGLPWRTFLPPVYLPYWRTDERPSDAAPFSSITHWSWGHQLRIEGRLMSTSKRDAYLRYVDIPRRVSQPFELSVHLHDDDPTGERAMLESHGWSVSDPRRIARTPDRYRDFIRSSRAEFSCPKPAFRELRTGWFSDRSAAYLASGRPVLAEDTGFSPHVPTGEGLLIFTNMGEAVDGVVRISSDYARHSKAARTFAEEHLDALRIVREMLEA